jgi:predicted nucleic acid-binding protein
VIVVDTNVLGYFYFPSATNDAVERLRLREKEWAAPEVWKSEFLNVATLYFRRGFIEIPDAIGAVEDAHEFVFTFEVHSEYKAILDLVKNSACSSYDCEFVVLAEKLKTRLLTYDKKILHWFPAIAIKPEDFLALEQ